MLTHDYMQYAFDEALIGMRNNEGGPFGAIIVLNNEIIGRGHNKVISQYDPTAHAEIVAIKDACHNRKSFHLNDAILYTTCEPCPMCLAAIYWAKIKTIFYYYDRFDAANSGFNDNFIYEEFEKPVNSRSIEMKKIEIQTSNDLFEEWENKQDKKNY